MIVHVIKRKIIMDDRIYIQIFISVIYFVFKFNGLTSFCPFNYNSDIT